jgi:hypothetical protein
MLLVVMFAAKVEVSVKVKTNVASSGKPIIFIVDTE